MLAVADITTPSTPLTLALLDLGTTTGFTLIDDVVLREEQAFVSGKKPVTVNGVAQQEASVAVINLADPTHPQYAGTITGVGGRLAFGSGATAGLLFSTAKSNFGGPDPGNGIHVATLGQLALIEGTEPRTVVVGEGPRTAENSKLKFRVIPGDYEVRSASIEYVVGEQRVGAPVAVTLPDGRGDLPLPLGFVIPKLDEELARPQLVINAGAADELISGRRAWRTAQFHVRLAGEDPSDLEGDYEGDQDENGNPAPLVAGGEVAHVGDAVAANEELVRRKLNGEPARTLAVTWRQQGGVGIYPDRQQRDDGYYESFLEGRRVSGTVHQATALAGEVVLGRSELVPMLPGPAASVSIALPANQPGSDGTVAADGKTQITLEALALDADGNAVADGTPARCRVDADEDKEGEIVAEGENELLTHNGKVQCTYQAGVQPLDVDRVTVEIDDVEVQREVILLEMKPTVSLNAAVFNVGDEVVATLRAGNGVGEPPADGTRVWWFLPYGARLLQRDEVMTNGEARARFVVTWTMTAVDVLAMVGSETATASALVAATAEHRLRFEESVKVLAGDLPGDGVGQLPTADGGSLEVPAKVRTQIKVSGGLPGESVTLRVGTLDTPNRQPEARYLMQSIVPSASGGVVEDLFGRHPAWVSGDVSVAPDSSSEGGTSLSFDGAGRLEIAAEGVLAQSLGLQVSLWVKAATQTHDGQPFVNGTLIKRADSFELGLWAEPGGHRVRLSVYEGGVERVVAGALIADGAWSRIDARLDSGQLTLRVGEEEVGAAVTSVDAGSGDLVVGDSLVGQLDDLRLYHASGSVPLLMIETGQGLNETAEAVFDETGTAFFSVRAMNVLSGPRSPLDADVEQIEDAIRRSYYVKFRAFVAGAQREGRMGVALRDFSVLMSYLAEALQVGTSEYGDLETTLADTALGVTPLGVVTTGREAMQVADRAYVGRLRGQDKATAALLVASVVAMAVATKKVKQVEAGASAVQLLKAMHRLRRAGKLSPKIAGWMARAAHNGRDALHFKYVVPALLDHGDEVAAATMDVLAAAESNWVHLRRLNQVLGAAGSELPATVQVLRGMAVSGPKGAVLVREALAVAKHSPVLTAKAVEGAGRLARGMQQAREARAAGQRIVVPGEARLANMARNFSPAQARKLHHVLKDVAAIADDDTKNLHRLVSQLGSLRGSNNYIAKGADAVVRYAKGLGRKVSEVERRLTVPGVRASRDYDLSYKLAGGGFLDIDVKDWGSFSPTGKLWRAAKDGKAPGKEAYKVQRDIVLKFLELDGPNDYTDLQWAIPKALRGKEAQIKKWMLDQFDSEFVRANIPVVDLPRAKAAFNQALARNLLDFY
jgi:hypothetical protein